MDGPEKNRIGTLRTGAGLSIQELADRCDTTYQQIYRLEKGERRLTATWMRRIAAALHCDPMDLLEHSAPPPNNVQVTSMVGEGERCLPLEKGLAIALPYYQDGLQAVRVNGFHLWPRYGDGDVLLFAPRSGVDEAECLGQYCVVHTKAGGTYVKRPMAGSRPQRYRLTSLREPDIDDVVIVWASPILWVRTAAAAALVASQHDRT